MLSLPKITRSIGSLINDLYTIGDRNDLFQLFCSRLEKMVPFSSAMLTRVDAKSKQVLFEDHLRFRTEERDALLFCSRAGSCHPVLQGRTYRALLTCRKNVPVRLTDIVPLARFADAEYARTFLSRDVSAYELFAVLGQKKDLIGCLLLRRSRRHGDFSNRDRELVGILLPHLARAFHHLDMRKQMEIKLAALGASPGAVEHLYPALTAFRLTPRQLAIGALAMLGSTNREIAVRLAITEPQVKNHLEGIYRRIGVKHRNELSSRVSADHAA